jgi:hypothetical protein
VRAQQQPVEGELLLGGARDADALERADARRQPVHALLVGEQRLGQRTAALDARPGRCRELDAAPAQGDVGDVLESEAVVDEQRLCGRGARVSAQAAASSSRLRRST